MVENAQIFQQVLTNDEQVIRVFKPHKGRFWASRLLGHLPALFFLLVFGVIFGAVIFVEAGLAGGLIALFIILAVFGLILLFFGIELLAGVLWYKNRWYCFTNRRVIIQCGIIGRNFRFLDLNQNMNSFVRISVLDRMLRKNTGSIKFWTMMNPGMNFGGGGGWGAGHGRGMGTTPGMTGSMFYFMYVQNPHEILREIQDQVQNNQNQLANLNQQQINLMQQLVQNTSNNNAGGNMGNNNMGGMNNNQGFNNNNNNQNFNNNNNNWNNNNNNNNGNNW
ncbi:MAG: hypothetical protein FWC80_00315 [Firmicutes bacterium]|nr:hypothetical protein [Bacillota bacterium]